MAAPARPYWKGYLQLSLVSCPISLYTAASSSERVGFRQINKQTGNRLRQQLIDEVTQKPVGAEDKGRGYEYAKGVYLQVEDEELDAIAIESSHMIGVDRFVPRSQIDERYLESPYYIVPNDKVGQEAFAVIREAMRVKDMVALGRVVLAKRERVIMLQPWGKGILGETLRYDYEIRNADEYFDDISDIKIKKEMLDLAQHIVASKTGDFNPKEFRDEYEEAVVEMLKKKQAGAPVPKDRPAAAPSNVVDLMQALRRSIGQSAPAAKVEAAKPAKTETKKAGKRSKAIPGQRELLLPITGSGKGKVAAESVAEPKKASGKPAATRRKAS
ncbi:MULTISPECIES: Ku protein [unclassified Beijerinckia]|uniref:non-homologous end joining protein Ku n=1 Tax=unclassified Beijerinckia TaxID=2638183 RepID=UPI000898BD06|nr:MULTISPECIES: Ku protein [unclassified Beijerinckia]MDH7794807.1 DNA end-binding protein Ku [Beijerinckia sp. GAS462]SEB75914.1 DNA end-binding protein Ku [Beijerinckia sp. 28-YEA-48]